MTNQLAEFLGNLKSIIASRKTSSSEKSYTSKLLAAGVVKIGSKVTEEAGELVEAAMDESDERVVSEAADLFYHAYGVVGMSRFNSKASRNDIGRTFWCFRN